MDDNLDKTNQLLEKLQILLRKQDEFQKEINELRNDIYELKSPYTEPIKEAKTIKEEPLRKEPETIKPVTKISDIVQNPKIPEHLKNKDFKTATFRPDLEKFIGENLINKIGIVITVLGVAIGTKYAIEHQMVSPLTRIILGYLFGLVLLGFAIKLKTKYENFSAVLLSGSMAIMYFITYSAYSFNDLIPQALAFFLMVFFTAFTVAAAINYNMQVIANIGLVGAYAVPFLLSEGSGKVIILFSYMAIINAGILFIALKKYWKPLFYSSFILSWLIYIIWYLTKYQSSVHFSLALTFLTIFFLTFYAAFLGYKLIRKEVFKIENVVLLLINSFIFYGIGYIIISDNKIGAQLLGLFTLLNALIHFIVGAIIYRQKLYDRNLFYFIAGLVLVFITIAIPVQLNGNWVTLLWACETALLFWIGRTKNVIVYERLSYILMFLALFSLFQDWAAYNDFAIVKSFTPLFNINFLTSIIFIAAFAFINYIHFNKKYKSPLLLPDTKSRIISFSIPGILMIIIYFSFLMEISNYFYYLYVNSLVQIKKPGMTYPLTYQDNDILKFKNIWIINYSLMYLSILSFINFKKIRSNKLANINLVLNAFFIGVFLTISLLFISELRESFLNQYLSEYYTRGTFNILIRYISIAFFCLLLISNYIYIRQDFVKRKLTIVFDLTLSLSIIWLASSELINWMDIFKSAESYKLELSLLWGFYALILIVLGIRKKKIHLRIGAITLFAVTLVKLFAYDISYLDTISKTIVFVSLGILLLVISFLYNKYKNIIFEKNEN